MVKRKAERLAADGHGRGSSHYGMKDIEIATEVGKARRLAAQSRRKSQKDALPSWMPQRQLRLRVRRARR